jgi:transposase
MLHYDKAPPHTSLLIREFLAKQETIVVPQPPYSPDLAPADFFLFPKLKSTLKGRRFQTVEIKENSL